MKGIINDDHIPLNKFELRVLGLPSLVFTTISGLEEVLDAVDLPDRTTATGGNTQPVEFEGTHPTHHKIEESLLELWYQEGQDPVSPLYKKAGALILKSNTGDTQRTYPIVGMYIRARVLPDLDIANEGEMAVTTWRFRANDILPPV